MSEKKTYSPNGELISKSIVIDYELLLI